MKRLIAVLVASLSFVASAAVTVNGTAVCAPGTPVGLSLTLTDLAVTCTPPSVAIVTPVTPPVTAPVVASSSSSGCSLSGVRANLTGSYASDTPTIARNGYASYVLPRYTAANIPVQVITSTLSVPKPIVLSFTGVNNNTDAATSPRWGAQFVISPCPGDFKSAPDVCTTWGIPDNGGIVLHGYAVAPGTGSAGNCNLNFGTQYYLNIRFIGSDKVTPSCANGACTLIVNFNSSAAHP